MSQSLYNNFEERFEKIERLIEQNRILLEDNKRQLDKNSELLEENRVLLEENRRQIDENERHLNELERDINNVQRALYGEYLNNNIKLNSKEINQLEEISINDEFIKNTKESICPICQDNYSISDKICYLPCFHFFHSSCIKKWLEINNRCPLCNNNI